MTTPIILIDGCDSNFGQNTNFVSSEAAATITYFTHE